MSVKDLLRRAYQRLRRLGRPDPADPRATPAEEQLRALLDDLVDKAVEAAHPTARTPWAIRPHLDREAYLQAVLVLIDEARDEGREQVDEELLEQIGWECCCRCRAHHRIGCPLCLNVFGCTVHTEVHPEQLRVDLLRDAPTLARALYETRAELAGERGVDLPTWSRLGRRRRGDMIEAARRVVSVRLPPEKKHA